MVHLVSLLHISMYLGTQRHCVCLPSNSVHWKLVFKWEYTENVLMLGPVFKIIKVFELNSDKLLPVVKAPNALLDVQYVYEVILETRKEKTS